MLRHHVPGGDRDIALLTTDQTGLVTTTCPEHFRCPDTYRFSYEDFVSSPGFVLYAGTAAVRAVSPTTTPTGLAPTTEPLTPDPDGRSATATPVRFAANDCYLTNITLEGFARRPRVLVVQNAFGSSLREVRISTDGYQAKLCAGQHVGGGYTIVADDVPVGTFTVSEPKLQLVRTHQRTMAVRATLDGKPFAGQRVVFQQFFHGKNYYVFALTTNRYGLASVTCSTHYRCPDYYRYAFQSFATSNWFRLYSGSANARTSDATITEPRGIPVPALG